MDRENLLNIQNDFFNQARKDKARVLIFLNSGKKLIGRIKSFDRFTVILESGQGEQMIFKHAIATVTTSKTFGNYINFDAAAEKGQETSQPETAQKEREGEGRDGAVVE